VTQRAEVIYLKFRTQNRGEKQATEDRSTYSPERERTSLRPANYSVFSNQRSLLDRTSHAGHAPRTTSPWNFYRGRTRSPGYRYGHHRFDDHETLGSPRLNRGDFYNAHPTVPLPPIDRIAIRSCLGYDWPCNPPTTIYCAPPEVRPRFKNKIRPFVPK
jgi:hypothetical protein